MSFDTTIVKATAGIGAFSYLTGRLHESFFDLAFRIDLPVHIPITTVSIVIPAYNEEKYLERTLRSILSQTIISKHREYFECIVVDNESTDRTAEIARKYCQVTSAPRGKLNARDAGIKHAVGNIIVSCDADTYYPPNYLNILLRHFYDDQVVAVNGVFLLDGAIFYKIASLWGQSILFSAIKRLWGACSAFRKIAYLETGGFNLSVDQFDRIKIATEEEFLFYYRLSKIGRIVPDGHAVCISVKRGIGEKALAEQRLPVSPYTQEAIEGRRF